MTFEKDYPGLKDKAHFVTEFKLGERPKDTIITDKGKIEIELSGETNHFEGKTVNIIGISCRIYNEEDIQKHCLDKQKVIEVIDKELGVPHMQQARQLGKTWLVSFFVQKRIDIYKELGLK